METEDNFGGLYFNPDNSKVICVGRILKKISKKQAEALFLKPLIIPGRTLSHSHWRLLIHFREKVERIKYYTILKYDKKLLGKEGAVRIIWWLKKD